MLIIASPIPIAVTIPFGDTTATFVFVDLKVISLRFIGIVYCSPFFIDISFLSNLKSLLVVVVVVVEGFCVVVEVVVVVVDFCVVVEVVVVVVGFCVVVEVVVVVVGFCVVVEVVVVVVMKQALCSLNQLL